MSCAHGPYLEPRTWLREACGKLARMTDVICEHHQRAGVLELQPGFLRDIDGIVSVDHRINLLRSVLHSDCVSPQFCRACGCPGRSRSRTRYEGDRHSGRDATVPFRNRDTDRARAPEPA